MYIKNTVLVSKQITKSVSGTEFANTIDIEIHIPILRIILIFYKKHTIKLSISSKS